MNSSVFFEALLIRGPLSRLFQFQTPHRSLVSVALFSVPRNGVALRLVVR